MPRRPSNQSYSKVVFGDLRNAVMDAKDSARNNKRHIETLLKHTKKVDHKEFFAYFRTILSRAMVLPSLSPEAGRMISFAVDFLVACQVMHVQEMNVTPPPPPSANDESDPYAEDSVGVHPLVEACTFRWLICKGVHNSKDACVRYHVTRMLALLLQRLPDSTRLEYDLYNEIQKLMLLRVKDRVAGVRVQAVRALHRFQDPHNRTCIVTEAYIFHCEKDPNWLVRRASLTNLQASRRAFKAIVGRIRDVNVNVRKEAYVIIGQKIGLKAMKASDREEILRNGLTDRNEHVVRAVERAVVAKWIHCCNGIMPLLEKIDLLNASDAGTLLLDVYFRRSSAVEIVGHLKGLVDDATKLIPQDRLTLENVFYWAEALKYMKMKVEEDQKAIGGTEEKPLKPFKEQQPSADGQEDEDDDDETVREEEDRSNTHYTAMIEPLAVEFAEYIRKFSETEPKADEQRKISFEQAKSVKLAILVQFINLCASFNYSDAAGRREVGKVFKALLVNRELPRSVVETIVKIFPKIYPEARERLDALLDIVSEIREPLVVQPTTKKCRVLSEQAARTRIIELKKREMAVEDVRLQMDMARDSNDFKRMVELAALYRERGEAVEEFKAEMQREDEAVAAFAREQEEEHAERNDPESLVRALDVIYFVMRNLRVHPFPDQLVVLKENFVMMCIQNKDLDVRNAGVKVLGQCCTMSLMVATEHFPLFLQIMHMDADFIIRSAMKGLFDMYTRWGERLFTQRAVELSTFSLSMLHINDTDTSSSSQESEVGEERTVKDQMLGFLLSMLGHDDKGIRSVCALGLCKLMMVDYWLCPKVLSRLLILFYNPAQHDLDDHIHQVLSGFLTLFSLKAENRYIMEAAFFRTLTHLWNAPIYSPLATINWEDTARTMIDMIQNMDNRVTDGDENPIQENLAYSILGRLMDPKLHDEVIGKVLAKSLNFLELPQEKYVAVRGLLVAARKVTRVAYWKDRPSVLRHLEKFVKTCEAIMATAPRDMYPDASSVESYRPSSVSDSPEDSMIACVSRNDTSRNESRRSGIKPIVRRRRTLLHTHQRGDEETLDMERAHEGLDVEGLKELIANGRTSEGSRRSDWNSPSASRASSAFRDREPVFVDEEVETLVAAAGTVEDVEEIDAETDFRPPASSTAHKPARPVNLQPKLRLSAVPAASDEDDNDEDGASGSLAAGRKLGRGASPASNTPGIRPPRRRREATPETDEDGSTLVEERPSVRKDSVKPSRKRLRSDSEEPTQPSVGGTGEPNQVVVVRGMRAVTRSSSAASPSETENRERAAGSSGSSKPSKPGSSSSVDSGARSRTTRRGSASAAQGTALVAATPPPPPSRHSSRGDSGAPPGPSGESQGLTRTRSGRKPEGPGLQTAPPKVVGKKRSVTSGEDEVVLPSPDARPSRLNTSRTRNVPK